MHEWLSIVALVSGFALVTFAIVGHRLPQWWRRRRRCPRCRYDMSHSGGLVCSECGFTARRERQLFRARRRRWLAVPAIVLVAAGHVFRATPEIKERGWMAAIPTSALVLMVPVLRPDRQAYCDIPYGPIPGSRSTPGVRERLCFELVRHRLQDEDWTWYQTLLLEMVTAPPPSPYENAGFEWRSRSDRCLGSMRWADGQKLQWRYESPDLSARVVLKTRRAWPAGVEILGRAYYMRTRGGTTAEWRAVARTQGLRDLSFEGLLTGRCGNGPPQPWSDKLRVLADRTTTGPSLRYDIELERQWLDEKLGVRLAPSKIASLVQMDRPGNVGELLSIAHKAAAKQVDPAHFPAAFDAIAV